MQAIRASRVLRAVGGGQRRQFGCAARLGREAITRGLVVGMYDSHKLFGGSGAGVAASVRDRIVQEAQAVGNTAGGGTVQLVLSPDLTQHIAVVGLGSEAQAGGASETVRMAVASGIKQLKAKKVTQISVGPMPDAHAAGEAAALAAYDFRAFKTEAEGDSNAALSVSAAGGGCGAWRAGLAYGSAQNLARELMATPANHMTPAAFAQRVERELGALGGVAVRVHDEAWARAQRMGGLLAVAQGSAQPLRVVEVEYRGRAGGVDLALVGKGITFDTGGYSLKLGKGMDAMKGDMGGGAAVVAAVRAVAQLRLPINVVAVVPLCENMVSGAAAKVSDVYTSRAGLTVEIMNTDAEGRIVLADALHYAVDVHRPRTVVDVATLTGAMVVALGDVYTGVFTPSPALWRRIKDAARRSDEPVWRMPLHDRWDRMLASPVADLSNIGSGPGAGACTAAAFLRRFVAPPTSASLQSAILREQCADDSLPRWAHLDIAGPMEAASSDGYHSQGMSGRPTRLLIELARQMSEGEVGEVE